MGLQALKQALMVAKDLSIDLKDLKRWAKIEGFEKKFKEFQKKIKVSKKSWYIPKQSEISSWPQSKI